MSGEYGRSLEKRGVPGGGGFAKFFENKGTKTAMVCSLELE